jgi:uncharacterized protein (TIGR00369 family)
MTLEELQRFINQSPVQRELQVRAVDAAADTVHFTCRADARHVGEEGGDVIHGGVIALILDTAASFALIQASGNDWATVDLRIDYLRPVGPGDLIVKATAVHVGRRTGRATAELSGEGGGRLAAIATGTFTRLERVLGAQA